MALKILAPELAHDPEVVRRFQAEARAAAALGHNHVVTVYDVGSHGDVHYLSMEHMDGGSWADRLAAQGALPWTQVLRILSEICSALEFAAERGLVHRDIKPANLMTTSTGVTKLADLGLVLDLQRDEAGGPLVGTPHFMAPELIRGTPPARAVTCTHWEPAPTNCSPDEPIPRQDHQGNPAPRADRSGATPA